MAKFVKMSVIVSKNNFSWLFLVHNISNKLSLKLFNGQVKN